ncbi:salicylate synthase [Pseudonocardia sp. GCM10023141]|uniref:salicylate synthase n=1 Tax=Pseudonocardia sp. GCM10023141 TaxID=3252653 RepID=UPI003614028D
MSRYHVATLDIVVEPVRAVRRLVSSGLLGRYVMYERGGRYHLAGRAEGEVVVDGRQVRSTRAADGSRTNEDWTGTPWPEVSAAIDRVRFDGARVYGFACFDLAAQIGTGTAPAGRDETLAHMIVAGLEVELCAGRAVVRSVDPELLEAVACVLAAPDTLADPVPSPVDVRTDCGRYRGRVDEAISDIATGRLQKVILSRSVVVEFPVDIPATYELGRSHNTPTRSFLLDLGGWIAAGFSPESLVEVGADGSVSTQPLAGTRAFTGDEALDAKLRAELVSDPKEIFEHATSVKLAVEEVTEIATAGSVRITEFLAVKQRGSVQHLGSRVMGDLLAEKTVWDALGAVFPAVTASGIPKRPAYDLISELEDGPRGLYAGTVFMLDTDGALDAALVLRAIYQRDGRAWLRAGAGIVGASRSEREYEETCEKLMSVAPYVVPAMPATRQPIREKRA